MINVKDYGAIGDGYTSDAHTTEDTQGFIAALAAAGPNNRVYFPPGTYWIDGTQINFPNIKNSGWLSIELDGTINLVHGPLCPKINTVIEGKSGDPQALAGAFVFDRYASIQVKKGYGNFSCFDLAGVQGIVLRGLNIWVDGSAVPVHIHDDNGAGSVWNKIESCVIACTDQTFPSILIDSSSPDVVAGFGLLCREVSVGGSSFAIKASNFGWLVMRDSFIAGNGVFIQNLGIPSMGGFEFENILTEGFVSGASFLTTRGIWMNNVSMRQIHIADPMGPVYLIDAQPAPGNPPKYGIIGVEIMACDGYTEIINPVAWPNGATGVGVAAIHGFDVNGDVININPYSSYQ